MKYFQIEGVIDEDLVAKFMEFCNNNLNEDCTFVINSAGGKSTLAIVILDIINSNKEKITLISAGCYSAAFYIFYFAKCKRKIVHGSLGMYHKSYIKGIWLNSDKTPKYYEDECQIENLDCIDDGFIKKVLSKKEKLKYEKSDDIYFTFNRMKEIFPKVEIIK